jgi:hypothetical protein
VYYADGDYNTALLNHQVWQKLMGLGVNQSSVPSDSQFRLALWKADTQVIAEIIAHVTSKMPDSDARKQKIKGMVASVLDMSRREVGIRARSPFHVLCFN